MQFGDLQKEFERIRALLQAGLTKLSREDYEGACEALEECLEMLEKGHPQDHPDRVACLQGLGDTYFALHRYSDARKIFEELVKISDAHPDSRVDGLLTQFKLAKSAERAGHAEDAIAIYEKLTTFAEQSLDEGHPAFSTILESHAAFLSSTGLKKEAAVLYDRARINRKKQAEKGSLLNQVLSSLSREEETQADGGDTTNDDSENFLTDRETAIYAGESKLPLSSRKQSMQAQAPGGNRNLAACCLSMAALLGAALGIVYFTSLPTKQKSQPVAAVVPSPAKTAESFQPQSYFSLDGKESLELIDSTNARLTVGGASKTLSWCRAGSVVAALHMTDYMTFTDHDGVLTDVTGLRLYKQGASELAVVKNMMALSEAASKGYKLDNQYPEDLGRVLSLGQGIFQANPVNANLPSIKIVYLGRDQKWEPDNARQEPATLAELRQTDQPAFSEDRVPGCVYGYYLLSGNANAGLSVKAFFTRGCDRLGNFLRSTDTGINFIAYNLNGRPTEISYSQASAGGHPWELQKVGFIILASEKLK